MQDVPDTGLTSQNLKKVLEKNVNFQQSPTRPLIDILLGLDCAEKIMHMKKLEVDQVNLLQGLLHLDGHVLETLILCIPTCYKQTLFHHSGLVDLSVSLMMH